MENTLNMIYRVLCIILLIPFRILNEIYEAMIMIWDTVFPSMAEDDDEEQHIGFKTGLQYNRPKEDEDE